MSRLLMKPLMKRNEGSERILGKGDDYTASIQKITRPNPLNFRKKKSPNKAILEVGLKVSINNIQHSPPQLSRYLLRHS